MLTPIMLGKKIGTLAFLRFFVGTSALLVLATMFVPARYTFRDFMIGMAGGCLVACTALLFNLDSVVSKDELRGSESGIQTLRLR